MASGENSRFVFVVVDGAITSASPRAWVFDTQEDAVKFRCEKIEMHSRRVRSLTPIYRVEINAVGEGAMLEIDWSQHQLAKQEQKRKFL